MNWKCHQSRGINAFCFPVRKSTSYGGKTIYFGGDVKSRAPCDDDDYLVFDGNFEVVLKSSADGSSILLATNSLKLFRFSLCFSIHSAIITWTDQ